MQNSIRPGVLLPESYAQFLSLRASAQMGKPSPGLQTKCYACGVNFSIINTTTPAGWRETQISGSCENCFDQLFEGEE